MKTTKKNMKYGAYELKRLYMKYELQGLIVAVLIHAIFIFSYVFATFSDLISSNKTGDEKINDRVITISDLEPPPPMTDDVEQPSDVDVNKMLLPLKDMTALDPEPVATQEAEILTTKTQDALDIIRTFVSSQGDVNASNIEWTGDIKINDNKIDNNINKDDVIKNNNTKVNYQQFEVEKAPDAVNLGSVKSSMNYPEIAIHGNIEGRVTVKVLVGKDGSVVKIGKISGPSVFHSEVRDKVWDLQFTPALQNGKTVNCWVSVPFSFKLS